MADKQRADVALVARGLAESREKAQALVMAGLVYLGEVRVDKPSVKVSPDEELTVRDAGRRYVSRGALKLEKGLGVFSVDPAGRTCLDLGASTGGFTDVLLQGGAEKVYAVDVGYGQLDWRLREDPRVVVMERTNARYLTPADFPERPDLAVMDVSFISITKILPAAAAILTDAGEFVTLVKPQFEAGRDRVGKKGVVRDPEVHRDVLRSVLRFVREEMGWHPAGLSWSPIRGPEGNIEFLLHLLPRGEGQGVTEEDVLRAVREAHGALSEGGGA